MVQPVISKQRLLTVRDLFEDVPHGAPPLQLTLEGALARLAAIESLDKEVSPTDVRWARKLKEATGYCLRRFRDSIARRTYLEWLRKTFATLSGAEQYLWRQFAGLAVKDFHADIVSTMDAAAPLVFRIKRHPEQKHNMKPQSFTCLEKPRNHSIEASEYRTLLEAYHHEVLQIVDETGDWFPYVRMIRNHLIHRKHTRWVLLEPHEGFFFQLTKVGNAKDNPMVTDPILLKTGTTMAADFELYSAWVLAETAYFLEALGCLIAEKLGSFEEHLPRCYDKVGRERVVLALDWPSLPADLDRIMSRLNDNQARHSSESPA